MAEPRRLRRVLALRGLIVVAAASMGPAFSLQTTLGAIVAAAGPLTVLALVATTLVMLLVALAYRALGRRDPNAGSSYTWIRDAFGPIAGAYGAWVLVAGNVLAIVATALPAGTGLLQLVAPALASSPLAVAVVASAFTAGAAWLLWRGLAPTARVSLLLLAAELVLLGAAAGWAWTHPRPHALAGAPPVFDLAALAAAMTIGIWMLDGWEVSASAAEDALDGPVAGNGGLAGLLLSAAVVVVAAAAFTRVADQAGFAAHTDDSLTYAGSRLGNALWVPALEVTVLVSLTASLQTTLVYLTRSLFAIGRDGTLPGGFGRLDAAGEPRRAIVVMAAIGIGLALATGLSPTAKAAFDLALTGTSWFIGALFLLSAAAAVKLFARDGEHRWDGAAAGAAGALALAAILTAALVRADGTSRTFIAAVALVGVPLAWWRGRSRTPTV